MEGEGERERYTIVPLGHFQVEEEEEEEEEEPEWTKGRLSTDSVIAMAQSVGVTLNEEVADALGQVALGRVRSAVSLAIEFADHEHSGGLETSHFSKAEGILNSPSYGNRSNLPEPELRAVFQGNFTFYDEAPEIDILSTLALKRKSRMRVGDIDPEFHVQDVVISNRLGEPETEMKDYQGTDKEEVKAEVNGQENHLHNGETEDHLNEEEDEEDGTEEMIHRPYLELEQEWMDYLKIFMAVFLQKELRKTDDRCGSVKPLSNAEEFSRIIDDLSEYSALPVADVICDFFKDYLNESFTPVTPIGLQRIAKVFSALINGLSRPPKKLLQKMSSVLIEVFIRPPDVEVQRLLVQTFVKILKTYDDLFAWGCSYVTQVLKRTSNMTVQDINDDHKRLLYGALLLANALRCLNDKAVQEFDWNDLVAEIVNSGLPSITANKYLKVELDRFQSSSSSESDR